MVIRVLDLYSGSGSVAKGLAPWAQMFQVTQVELDPDYALSAIMDPPASLKQHVVADALTWDAEAAGPFDIVWASPPCRTYSLLQNRWRNAQARELLMRAEGDPLVQRALDIIALLKPAVWFLENPMTGALSKRAFMQGMQSFDVSYCHYGSPGKPWGYRKDTRIWTNMACWEGARLCRRDCTSFANGRHAGQVVCVRKQVRGQVPPALIRALFSAASTSCTMALTTKQSEILGALKESLISKGIPAKDAGVWMLSVGTITPPQKTPKRTDLVIEVGDKRYRSISAASKAILKLHQESSDGSEGSEAEPAAVPALEPEAAPEAVPETVTAPADDTTMTTVRTSEGTHYHFHFSIPPAMLPNCGN